MSTLLRALLLGAVVSSIGLTPAVIGHDRIPTQTARPGDLAGPALQAAPADYFSTWPLLYSVKDSLDNGSEMQGSWHHAGSRLGTILAGFDPGGGEAIASLRFRVPDLAQGQHLTYARLLISPREARGTGDLRLVIRGVQEDSPAPCSQTRLPSRLPKTSASSTWEVGRLPGGGPCSYSGSPDIAPILTEILARPGWGANAKVVALVIEPDTSCGPGTGYIAFDAGLGRGGQANPARLEVCAALEDAIVGKPLLGRPADRSVAVSVFSLVDLEAFLQYGDSSSPYIAETEMMLASPGEPKVISLGDLKPDTEYFYRFLYRRPGAEDFRAAPEQRFHTQRAPGEGFLFTVQADTHMGLDLINRKGTGTRLYLLTLDNILRKRPDFHIDLGDFSRIEVVGRKSAASQCQALERYLSQRYFLNEIGASVPFYLVLGNHEAEQGWRTGIPGDSLAVWGTRARNAVIPNPAPDSFYAGNQDTTAGLGFRQDYYAWQWGDALFVTLDPYSYTERRPHRVGGRREPSLDAWDWTLGKQQYEWLYATLHESDAKWKFVFAHQMTGGISDKRHKEGPYGRGGADAASYAVAGHATYEWGGQDSTGRDVFAEKRPGWEHGPIHRLMAEEGVDIFFRGHDHVFVYETLDGVVYQTCPAPNDRRYSSGFYEPGLFSTGVQVNNPGHLRVSVTPDSVVVAYVRTVLPERDPLVEEGTAVHNGDVSCSYTLRKPNTRKAR